MSNFLHECERLLAECEAEAQSLRAAMRSYRRRTSITDEDMRQAEDVLIKHAGFVPNGATTLARVVEYLSAQPGKEARVRDIARALPDLSKTAISSCVVRAVRMKRLVATDRVGVYRLPDKAEPHRKPGKPKRNHGPGKRGASSDMEQEIVAFLRQSPGGATSREILAKVSHYGYSEPSVYTTIKRAIGRRLIRKISQGHYEAGDVA